MAGLQHWRQAFRTSDLSPPHPLCLPLPFHGAMTSKYMVQSLWSSCHSLGRSPTPFGLGRWSCEIGKGLTRHHLSGSTDYGHIHHGMSHEVLLVVSLLHFMQ